MIIYINIEFHQYFDNPIMSVSSYPKFTDRSRDESYVISLVGKDLQVGFGFQIEIPPSIGTITFKHVTRRDGVYDFRVLE
jgi:hypothetical protein